MQILGLKRSKEEVGIELGRAHAIEWHFAPAKRCRPTGFRYADFSAPDPSGLVRPYRGCFAVLGWWMIWISLTTGRGG
jgi:hypothetical protein